jgi:hypothetical protein
MQSIKGVIRELENNDGINAQGPEHYLPETLKGKITTGEIMTPIVLGI